MSESFDSSTIDSKFIIESVGVHTHLSNVIKQLLTALIFSLLLSTSGC